MQVMDVDSVSKIALAVVSLAAAILQFLRARGGRRAQILSDIELYKALPDSSSAKRELLELIDGAIKALISEETEKRRDPTGIGLAISFLLLGPLAIAWGINGDGWWNVLILVGAVVLLFGIVGLSESATLKARDEKGNAIKTG
ncbi:MAG: hypothetical protein JWO76_3120 [Nocardioides sp.]|nr:hypothetical protein [Nocardioides sp.]